MSLGLLFDLALCALAVAVALWTIASRDAFASVISFVVYGLLLSIAWVRLGAPDVALTEAAIGAGLTGLLLLGALARTPRQAGKRAGAGARSVVAVACAAVGLGLAWTAVELTSASGGLQEAVRRELPGAGAENPVTAVLLNFRGYDTLLESLVLLASLLGVWTLADDRIWGRRPGVPQRVRPHGVLAVLGRFLPPLGVLIGVYVVWIGTSAPGGAFQGGAILAAVWLLVVLSAAARPPRVSSRRLRLALVLGPGLFLAAGVVGLATAGGFLAYPPDLAGPLILAVEAALTVSIAATLALLVAGPPVRR